MSNWFSEFADVVEHLVNTHPTFNQSLSQDEALAKIAGARALAAEHDAVHAVEHPADAASDWDQLVADVEDLKQALSQLTNPLTTASVATVPVVASE